ncbi:hypothetical protein PsAD2_03241 [Pseudovibrio axinellae]|uniref:GAF domain-containing protein n=1 Tax=Pseudovibrio axinellae TaxID=989403 RepID=A0A165WYG1_9HYPH|nr:GAF domain-containing protein [Pseudovibrio axinellae]KZL17038.1 hypothetical protein PsAD2_03241 [Pseudovibrio axinellae]SEQ17166.1 hypothetical protein SAMN05421798_10246 [Pseudovibrio axinellae]
MIDHSEFVQAVTHSAGLQDGASNVASLFSRYPGYKLFTLTTVHPDGCGVVRLYSSAQGAYSTAGTKPIEKEGGWYEQVFVRQKPFLGYTIEDVRHYFPDHEKIAAMGLGATLNLPVVVSGEVVGTVNLLDRDHAYTEQTAENAFLCAQALAPLFLKAREKLVVV